MLTAQINIFYKYFDIFERDTKVSKKLFMQGISYTYIKKF